MTSNPRRVEDIVGSYMVHSKHTQTLLENQNPLGTGVEQEDCGIQTDGLTTQPLPEYNQQCQQKEESEEIAEMAIELEQRNEEKLIQQEVFAQERNQLQEQITELKRMLDAEKQARLNGCKDEIGQQYGNDEIQANINSVQLMQENKHLK